MGASFQNEYKWMPGFQPLQEDLLKKIPLLFFKLLETAVSSANHTTPSRWLSGVHTRCPAHSSEWPCSPGRRTVWVCWRTRMLGHFLLVTLFLSSTEDLFQVAEPLEIVLAGVWVVLCSPNEWPLARLEETVPLLLLHFKLFEFLMFSCTYVQVPKISKYVASTAYDRAPWGTG